MQIETQNPVFCDILRFIRRKNKEERFSPLFPNFLRIVITATARLRTTATKPIRIHIRASSGIAAIRRRQQTAVILRLTRAATLTSATTATRAASSAIRLIIRTVRNRRKMHVQIRLICAAVHPRTVTVLRNYRIIRRRAGESVPVPKSTLTMTHYTSFPFFGIWILLHSIYYVPRSLFCVVFI